MLPLKDKRIFIVEDNLANRAIEQMILERNGARTAIERYGKETIQRLQAFAPVDIIVMDLMLPDGVSGFDVADQVRSIPEFQQIPIVAVSASDPAESMPRARAKGFAGFISKPIDFDTFAPMIARILDGEKVWAEGD
ncbi:MAG: response regulator [Chloroflexi bacterium]|nr:response regulator [Chloroflexota bacterium]